MHDLKIITMRDVEPETVDFLWNPYIPAGKITIIQGDGGCGKTTMALSIAAMVTTGGVLPEGYYVQPAHVIVQNAEDGLADTIVPRLAQFGADVDMVHFIDEGEQALTFSDERIERAIIEKGAKLFILDPVQAFLGNADMHSAGSMRPIMKKLGETAARTGCAIVLIGHLNKKGGRTQYRGLGSIDIQAAARSVLTVGIVADNDNVRAVVHSKSNLSAPGVSLAFTFDPLNGFTWLGEYYISADELLGNKKRRPESQFAKAQRFIETALSKGPVASTDILQAAEEQGISHKTLNRVKDAMGVHCFKQGRAWYWELPIDVEFTEVRQEGQDTQDGQDRRTNGGQEKPMAILSALTMLSNGTEG